MDSRGDWKVKEKSAPTVLDVVLAMLFLVFWVALGPLLTALGILMVIVGALLTWYFLL